MARPRRKGTHTCKGAPQPFGAPFPEPPDRREAVDSDGPKERPRLRGNPDNTRWQGYHHRNVRDERLHRACPCHPRGNAKGIQSKCQPGCPASELAWTLQRPDQRGEPTNETVQAWPVHGPQYRVREERGVRAVKKKNAFFFLNRSQSLMTKHLLHTPELFSESSGWEFGCKGFVSFNSLSQFL